MHLCACAIFCNPAYVTVLYMHIARHCLHAHIVVWLKSLHMRTDNAIVGQHAALTKVKCDGRAAAKGL